MKEKDKKIIWIMTILILFLVCLLLGIIYVNNNSNFNSSNKTNNDSNLNDTSNVIDSSVKEAEDILKVKDEIYSDFNYPQPYCGDNSIKLDSSENAVLGYGELGKEALQYWEKSTEFSTYEELKTYIMKNISEEIYAKIPRIQEGLYLENAGNLYCARIGTGIIVPEGKKYQILNTTDSTIEGNVTYIYSQEDFDLGFVSAKEINYTVKLEKSGENWIIVSYEQVK